MAPKDCTLCHTPRQILVRCQIDESGTWNFVCPGKCWHSVSGGVEDAKGLEGQYPFYRYGGMVSRLICAWALHASIVHRAAFAGLQVRFWTE